MTAKRARKPLPKSEPWAPRWRHIATAPKDGTRFICVDEDGVVSVGWWEIVPPAGCEELVRKFLAEGKVWHEKKEWDALVLKETGERPGSSGFWTSDFTQDEGVPEEADLRYWMDIPPLPDLDEQWAY